MSLYRYLFNVDLSLRDVLLNASIVTPRPHLLQSINSLTADLSVATGTAGIHSCVNLATILAKNGYILSTSSANEWLQVNTAAATAFTGSSSTSIYTWYNTHSESFNLLSTQQILYKLLIAVILAGLGKVLFKILPSVVFSTLYKIGILYPAKIHEKDCFDRLVPEHKSYVVEIPVRYILYCTVGYK